MHWVSVSRFPSTARAGDLTERERERWIIYFKKIWPPNCQLCWSIFRLCWIRIHCRIGLKPWLAPISFRRKLVLKFFTRCNPNKSRPVWTELKSVFTSTLGALQLGVLDDGQLNGDWIDASHSVSRPVWVKIITNQKGRFETQKWPAISRFTVPVHLTCLYIHTYIHACMHTYIHTNILTY